MFSAQTYVERRRRLREQLGSGVILLTGNEESSMSYADNLYDFRQDSSFLYFFGVDAPHLAGVIDVDASREIVFGDESGKVHADHGGAEEEFGAEVAVADGVEAVAGDFGEAEQFGGFLAV